jgi:hypothetical protein
MTPRDTFSEIRDLLELLAAHGISRYSNPVIKGSSKLNGEDVTLITTNSWASISGQPRPNLEEFFSVGEYCAAVREGNYSAILYDGAIIQIAYYFRRESLVGHRLCYFAMPCDVDQGLLDEFGPADVVEMVLEQEPYQMRLRSPLRFDYSAYGPPTEPESHLHLVFDESRLPVFGPLTLGHFCGLIFRLFYPQLCASYRFLNDLRPSLLHRTIRYTEETALHLSCRH